jgi:hypothetical protein
MSRSTVPEPSFETLLRTIVKRHISCTQKLGLFMYVYEYACWCEHKYATHGQAIMHNRAERLSQSLQRQVKRLRTRLQTLKQEGESVVGDALLGAVFVTCAGVLDESWRTQLLEETKRDLRQKNIAFTDNHPAVEYVYTQYVHKAQCTDTGHLRKNFGEQTMDTFQWHAAALPRACYESVCARSLENAAIALCNPTCTLFIDPDMQALQWFRRMQDWGAGSDAHGAATLDGMGHVNSNTNADSPDMMESSHATKNQRPSSDGEDAADDGVRGNSIQTNGAAQSKNDSANVGSSNKSIGRAGHGASKTSLQHNNHLTIVHASRSDRYIATVKTAISMGETVVIVLETEHDMDVMLSSLVALRRLKKGKSSFLWLGSEFVECDKVLGKIYILITNPPRHMPAHILASTIIVDCSVQDSGVYERMLAVITSAVRHDLEHNRVALLHTVTNSVSTLEYMQNACIDAIAGLSPQIVGDESEVQQLQGIAVRLEEEYTRLADGRARLDQVLHDSEAAAGDAAQSCARVWRVVRRMYYNDIHSISSRRAGNGNTTPQNRKSGYGASLQPDATDRDMYVFSIWNVLKLVYMAVHMHLHPVPHLGQNSVEIRTGAAQLVSSRLRDSGIQREQGRYGQTSSEFQFTRQKSVAFSTVGPISEAFDPRPRRRSEPNVAVMDMAPSSLAQSRGSMFGDVAQRTDKNVPIGASGSLAKIMTNEELAPSHTMAEEDSVRHHRASAESVEDTARRAIETHVASALFPPYRLPFAVLNHLMGLVHKGALTEAQLDVFLSPTAPPLPADSASVNPSTMLHGSKGNVTHNNMLLLRGDKKERMLREFSSMGRHGTDV